jgi:hypothetical protein
MVQGFAYGLGANGNAGSPWDLLLGIPASTFAPVSDPALCARIAYAAEAGVSPPDTLPIAGIIKVGEVGVVVTRFRPSAGSTDHPKVSMVLLNPGLVVLARR